MAQPEIWIYPVDSDQTPLKNPQLQVRGADQRLLKLRREENRWVGSVREGEDLFIETAADGFQGDRHRVRARGRVTQVVHGLRRPGERTYEQGNDRLAFRQQNGAYLMDIVGEGAESQMNAAAKRLNLKWSPVAPLMEMDTRSRGKRGSDSVLARVEGELESSAKLAEQIGAQKGLRVLPAALIQHGDRPPIGLTNEVTVRFRPEVKREEVERIAASTGFKVARSVKHLGNGFLLVGPSKADYEILERVETLRKFPDVEYAEVNLLFQFELDAYTPNDFLFGQVPHLNLIGADEAWDQLDNVAVTLRGGSPNITVGIADPQGVAPNHPDLTAALSDGTGKLVASVNFAPNPIVVQTVAGLFGDHGTQCATSAVAAFDDNRGIPGVAPNCHLVGAQIRDRTDAVRMSDLYLWMAGFDNGSTDAGFPALPARPCDVISSSFGQTGMALSNTMRDCFDFLTSYGRNGRGCVVLFSLGNSGYGDYTDPTGTRFRSWPTYEKTIGVGSSINVNPTNPATSSQADPNGATNGIATVVDSRALYSPFGATALRKPDLVSPSHTSYAAVGGALVDPVMAGMRVGTGNVDGCPGATVCNDYAFSFGGTSHSTPTAAGAVALVLSANPNLTWVQVRDILQDSCVRIDAGQTNAIGVWQDLDGDGLIDYSRWYGAGRLDVEAAVRRALDTDIPLGDAFVRENLTDIGDIPSGGSWWASPDIWVRRDATTPVPTLSWFTAPPHENARRGQDNAVFCRVRNRGAANVSTLYLRALLTHWAGLEFVFPADFQPSQNVGAALPSPLVPGTYLIGEARIDDLTPDENRIVKFVWPSSLVPPETVVVSGVNVRWHPCLLVDASPHDGPSAIGGLAIPVQGNNNIAQRNITIDPAGSGDSDTFVGMIAGTRLDVGVASLIVDATALQGNAAIRIHLADPVLMRRFIAAALAMGKAGSVGQPGAPTTSGKPGSGTHRCGVTVETRTRLRFECGSCEVVIEAAPGSRILGDAGCKSSGPTEINETMHQGIPAVELRNLSGRLEIPMRLSGGSFTPLLVALVGDSTGDLYLTQRRGDGEISAGYGIRRE